MRKRGREREWRERERERERRERERGTRERVRGEREGKEREREETERERRERAREKKYPNSYENKTKNRGCTRPFSHGQIFRLILSLFPLFIKRSRADFHTARENEGERKGEGGKERGRELVLAGCSSQYKPGCRGR